MTADTSVWYEYYYTWNFILTLKYVGDRWCGVLWWWLVVECQGQGRSNIRDSKVIEPMVIELLEGYWDRSRSLTKVKVIGEGQGHWGCPEKYKTILLVLKWNWIFEDDGGLSLTPFAMETNSQLIKSEIWIYNKNWMETLPEHATLIKDRMRYRRYRQYSVRGVKKNLSLDALQKLHFSISLKLSSFYFIFCKVM